MPRVTKSLEDMTETERAELQDRMRPLVSRLLKEMEANGWDEVRFIRPEGTNRVDMEAWVNSVE